MHTCVFSKQTLIGVEVEKGPRGLELRGSHTFFDQLGHRLAEQSTGIRGTV